MMPRFFKNYLIMTVLCVWCFFFQKMPVARFTKLSYDISYLMIETTLRSDL